MLDEDARGARTRKRLRRALVEEFPEFDAYAIDVAVAWDDARCPHCLGRDDAWESLPMMSLNRKLL